MAATRAAVRNDVMPSVSPPGATPDMAADARGHTRASRRSYHRDMDPLTSLLEGPRARGAFLLRAVLDPPWSLRIQDRAPLTVVAMVRGEAWVRPDGAAAERLRPGDVAIARGPDPYTVADDLATPVQVIIHPGERCATPDGRDLHEQMEPRRAYLGQQPDRFDRDARRHVPHGR